MTCDALIELLQELSAKGFGALPVAGPPTEFGTWTITGAHHQEDGYLEGNGAQEYVQLTDALRGGVEEENI